MDRQRAIDLTKELQRHPILINAPLDWSDIFNFLEKTGIKPSRRFAKRVEEREYLLDRTPDYQTNVLMLRRVLRNENATKYLRESYKSGPHKNSWGVLASGLGIYDSDVFTRKLMEDPQMLEMMAKAYELGHPHSILGKVTTTDRDSVKIVTRPIIIIPSADIEKIVEWELANRVYGLRNSSEKVKEISREQYYKP